ncbi:unnamed protein product [Candida verbasci]|uniref:Transmembrane protein 135 N-terminal domain-containing protein n=1 Tax=Candida verbasci TaxID=1227364 RepID=A0A9W4TT87_9ASCO|nr:unnamed protein product [Candida verbasci]
MAKLVALMNAFTPLCQELLLSTNAKLNVSFWSTFSSALIASFLTFPTFQIEKLKIDRHYTLDWTLILITRALDTIISSNFNTKKFVPEILKGNGDVVVFIISCFFIMVAWTFEPEKIDPGYLKWINDASMIDQEVVDGVRYMKEGTLDYSPTSKLENQNHYVNYCLSKKQDPRLGDLTIQEKLPCYVLHQFQTKSCKTHAILRFIKEFKFSFKLYSSLNLFMFVFIKGFKGKPLKLLTKTIRSSVFLASFTTLYWIAYCFIRNNHPKNMFNQKFWDLLAPYFGSIACGFSVLIEKSNRRNELSLFLAPKALGTFVDSTPSDRNLNIEIIAFSLSFATLIAYARSNPTKLRGLVGKGLSYMIQ